MTRLSRLCPLPPAGLPRFLSKVALLGLLAAAPALCRAAGGIPGYVVLPLTAMGRANQATIRVTLNGQPTMLVLDTGASGTALDRAFYNAARVRAGKIGPAELPTGLSRDTTANGERAEVGYIDSLTAGAMDFGKGPVTVTNLSGMLGTYNNYHHERAVAGLMGEDLLRRYAAIIDWRRRGVYFNTDPSKRLKPGPALTGSGWTAIPMFPTNGRQFAVPCTVSGKPVRLLVDTGATFTTFCPGIVPLDIIYNRDTKSSMVRLASTTSTASMIGLDMSVHPARVDHWKIGGYELPHSSVAVNKFPPGILSQESAGEGPVLGLLGAEVLASNNAVIDIAGATLYLKHSSR